MTKLELRRPSAAGATGPSPNATLALELKNTGATPAEFLQTLPLPPGVFARGFRLSVNGKLEPGRLFEKKTALWVYTMIRDSERRDPGLLYYIHPDELELRVFPVVPEQVTTVEIDFLLPDPAPSLPSTIGLTNPADVLTRLGRQIAPQLLNEEEGSVLTGALSAQALPVVAREPYLHLIIDRSENNSWAGDLPTTLRNLQKAFPTARQARITIANFEVVDRVRALTPIADLIAHPPDFTSAHLASAVVSRLIWPSRTPFDCTVISTWIRLPSEAAPAFHPGPSW